jgi:hypothetical protein
MMCKTSKMKARPKRPNKMLLDLISMALALGHIELNHDSLYDTVEFLLN